VPVVSFLDALYLWRQPTEFRLQLLQTMLLCS